MNADWLGIGDFEEHYGCRERAPGKKGSIHGTGILWGDDGGGRILIDMDVAGLNNAALAKGELGVACDRIGCT